MQVEILEKRLSDTDPETGVLHLLGKGDIVTVSDTCGEYWCSLGWAKDKTGKTKTGERIPGPRALDNAKLAKGVRAIDPNGGVAPLKVANATAGSRGRIRG